MKIGIQTWGSDGDIRPLFALSDGLRTAGHEVTVCYTSVDGTDYTDLAEKIQVKSFNVFPKPVNDIRLVGREIIKTSNALKQIYLIFSKFFEPAVEEMYKASKRLCRENDVVIGPFVLHPLYTAAEKYGCPRASVCLTPACIPSKYYPPLGSSDLGALLNSLQHFLGDKIGARISLPSVNKLQAMEGLPSVRRISKEISVSKHLTLVPVSPSLFPRKFDWDLNVQVCGFFNIPSTEDALGVSPELEEFIKADEPPVYLTFGSADYFQPTENISLFIEASKLSKQRAVIQTTANRTTQSIGDPDICIVGKVPHHAVFPLCSAIVHHGGAGTTQSSLLAGRPSVVVEHALDQSFWAQQLNKVGAAEKMLHRRTVTPRKLAESINKVLASSQYTENAGKIGEMMRKENGVKTAVQFIENRFQIR